MPSSRSKGLLTSSRGAPSVSEADPSRVLRQDDERISLSPITISRNYATAEAYLKALNLVHGRAVHLSYAISGLLDAPLVRDPDLVVIIEGEPRPAADAIRAARKTWPGAKVILAGLANQETATVLALSSGAHGVVFEDEQLDHIVAAMRAVLRGQLYAPSTSIQQVVDRVVLMDRPVHDSIMLSTRETQILGLVAAGKSNKDIANHLYLETQTVKNHLHHIFQKLGVRSRLDAARALGDYFIPAQADASRRVSKEGA